MEVIFKKVHLLILVVLIINYHSCMGVQNIEGVHLIYSKPVQIPINRDEPTAFSTGEVADSSSNRKQKDLNVQFGVQNPSDGTYHFGYDIAFPRSYREEWRERSGRVVGHYGYMDPDGNMHRFAYEADAYGYRSRVMDQKPIEKKEPVIQSPYSWRPKDVQLIGPIPKPWTELFGTT